MHDPRGDDVCAHDAGAAEVADAEEAIAGETAAEEADSEAVVAEETDVPEAHWLI